MNFSLTYSTNSIPHPTTRHGAVKKNVYIHIQNFFIYTSNIFYMGKKVKDIIPAKRLAKVLTYSIFMWLIFSETAPFSGTKLKVL